MNGRGFKTRYDQIEDPLQSNKTLIEVGQSYMLFFSPSSGGRIRNIPEPLSPDPVQVNCSIVRSLCFAFFNWLARFFFVISR